VKPLMRFAWRWGPAIAVMLVIFAFSSQPKGTLPDFGIADFGMKKLAHTLIYLALAVAMLRGVRGDAPLTERHAGIALILTVLYAMSDEFHQTLVTGRDGQWFDVGVDTAGATIGLACRLWVWPWLSGRFRRSEPPFQSKSE
jgi:VanZ family protein